MSGKLPLPVSPDDRKHVSWAPNSHNPVGKRASIISAERDVELASVSALLLHRINIGEQSKWCPVSSSQFDRVCLCLRPCDAAHYLRIDHGDTLPGRLTNIELSDIAHYVVKMRFWHEMTLSDGRQLALYLSSDGLMGFFSVLEATLRTLGKYDQLVAPCDVFTADDLKEQRVVVIRSLSLKDLHDEFNPPQQPHQPPLQRQDSDEHVYLSLRSSVTSDSMPHEEPLVVPNLGPHHPPTGEERLANLARAISIPPEPPPRPRNTHQPRTGFADAKHQSLPSRLHRHNADISNPFVSSSWSCGRCTFKNGSRSFECEMCAASRSDAWKCPAGNGVCPRGVNHMDQSVCSACGAWKCRWCTSINLRSSVSCVICERS